MVNHQGHKALGAGLLESAYQACLEIELKNRGSFFYPQYSLSICYEGVTVESAYRIDFLVANQWVVAMKAVIRQCVMGGYG